eukprot:CAMPEP_0206419390 /NCGR_PEP_ID=MMETSP0324_2-20121206/82_1 /ASSEMBLY_ACC=CAM_ASM_000836 /TAXON_ID=2866 /ORGANISM="Crypthecodinium cohnii, Strain Seligo" /LENGTH=68 /DNA_ID=CAMNT_0053882801 /DNA_START=718 /DNA_END=924 /DNA_ORIENTATION=+
MIYLSVVVAFVELLGAVDLHRSKKLIAYPGPKRLKHRVVWNIAPVLQVQVARVDDELRRVEPSIQPDP